MELSKPQIKAIKMLLKYRILERFDGGYWANRFTKESEMEVFKKGWSGRLEKDFLYPKENVGTNTINALIRKGLVEITEYRNGKYGAVPHACKLSDLSDETNMDIMAKVNSLN